MYLFLIFYVINDYINYQSEFQKLFENDFGDGLHLLSKWIKNIFLNKSL